MEGQKEGRQERGRKRGDKANRVSSGETFSLPHSKEKPQAAGWGGMLGVDEEAGLFHLISKWE